MKEFHVDSLDKETTLMIGGVNAWYLLWQTETFEKFMRLIETYVPTDPIITTLDNIVDYRNNILINEDTRKKTIKDFLAELKKVIDWVVVKVSTLPDGDYFKKKLLAYMDIFVFEYERAIAVA